MSPATRAVTVTRRTPRSPRMVVISVAGPVVGRARWVLMAPTMPTECAEPVRATSRLRGIAGPRAGLNRTGSGTRAPYTGDVPTRTLGANGTPPAARRQRADL